MRWPDSSDAGGRCGLSGLTPSAAWASLSSLSMSPSSDPKVAQRGDVPVGGQRLGQEDAVDAAGRRAGHDVDDEAGAHRSVAGAGAGLGDAAVEQAAELAVHRAGARQLVVGPPQVTVVVGRRRRGPNELEELLHDPVHVDRQ